LEDRPRRDHDSYTGGEAKGNLAQPFESIKGTMRSMERGNDDDFEYLEIVVST